MYYYVQIHVSLLNSILSHILVWCVRRFPRFSVLLNDLIEHFTKQLTETINIP